MIGTFVKAGIIGWKIIINSHAFEVLMMAYSGWALNDGYREIKGKVKEHRKARKDIEEKEELLRNLEKEYEEQQKKTAEEKAQSKKEADEEFERVKRELEEAKKNDPMKKEMERLIRKSKALRSED